MAKVHAQVKLPKKLADAFDTYYQTSRYAQQQFIPFNKDMILPQLEQRAQRYGFTLDADHARSKAFKGTFKLSGGRKKVPMQLRVSAKSLPLAEDWTA